MDTAPAALPTAPCQCDVHPTGAESTTCHDCPVEAVTCDDCGSQRHTTKQHVDRLARLSRIDGQIHDDEAGLRSLRDALFRLRGTPAEATVEAAITLTRAHLSQQQGQRDAVELDPRFTEARAA